MMIRPIRCAAALASAAALLLCSGAAHADYFVRPYISFGEEVIDGLEANGSTERSENFTFSQQAQVSLNQGTIRNYLEITGPGSYGQSTGVMGDRLTVNDAEGTTMAFAFAFDGNIVAPAVDPNLNSRLVISVFANLFVFDSSAGASYLNFDSQVIRASALVSEQLALRFDNPTEALFQSVDETLSGSFLVGAGRRSFDVFYSLSAFVATNDNPVTVTMDFLNTGRATVDTGPGVEFTSDSGVFLGSGPTAPVPEPASWLLMALGLATVAGAARRRQVRH